MNTIERRVVTARRRVARKNMITAYVRDLQIQGKSLQEIAEALSIPESSVRLLVKEK